jgi:hypothetical protein
VVDLLSSEVNEYK